MTNETFGKFDHPENDDGSDERKQMQDRTLHLSQVSWMIADNPQLYRTEAEIQKQIRQVAFDDYEVSLMDRLITARKNRKK